MNRAMMQVLILEVVQGQGPLQAAEGKGEILRGTF